jgi:hypothetical protein
VEEGQRTCVIAVPADVGIKYDLGDGVAHGLLLAVLGMVYAYPVSGKRYGLIIAQAKGNVKKRRTGNRSPILP